jgi:hypothetical protein
MEQVVFHVAILVFAMLTKWLDNEWIAKSSR